MTTGPPVARPLDRTCTRENEEYLKRIRSYVGSMGPKTMITCQRIICININLVVSRYSPAVIPLTSGLVLINEPESSGGHTEHGEDIIKCGPNDGACEYWYSQYTIEGEGRGDQQDGEIEPPYASDGRKAL